MELSIRTLTFLAHRGDKEATMALKVLRTFPYYIHSRGGRLYYSVGNIRETEAPLI